MHAIYSSLQRGVRADTKLHNDWIVLEISVSVLLVWPSCRTKKLCMLYSYRLIPEFLKSTFWLGTNYFNIFDNFFQILMTN